MHSYIQKYEVQKFYLHLQLFWPHFASFSAPFRFAHAISKSETHIFDEFNLLVPSLLVYTVLY